MQTISLAVPALLFILQVSGDLELRYLRGCRWRDALKDNCGHLVRCRKNTLPCPPGYACQRRMCCPLPISITTPAIPFTTPNSCPEFNGCPDGVIVYDENCPVCVIYDTCPGFPCPDHFYCFPTGTVLPNGQRLGQCNANPCSVGSPLEDANGFSVTCNVTGDHSECIDGYSCVANGYNNGVCCPLVTTTASTPTASTPTASTPTTTTCPEFDGCTDGVIVYVENCPVCVIYDTCPGFPCPDYFYCFPTGTVLPNGQRLGQCNANPCSVGSPLEDENGFSVTCNVTGDHSECIDGYSCVANGYNNGVCCPLVTTTASTTCPTVPNCTGGIIENISGCDKCIHFDSCPFYPCPDGLFCLSYKYYYSNDKYLLTGLCVANPCSFGQPMDDEGTILCETGAPCPGYSTCTLIDSFPSVCCQVETSTEYFTTTTTMECDGMIIIDADGKPLCVYPDTCVQLGCQFGEICLVDEEGVLYPKSSCVTNYCGNLLEYTASSCNDSKVCQPEYTCVPIPNDMEGRGMCCSSLASTTQLIP